MSPRPELGGRVVAHLVERRLDAEYGGHPVVALGHPVWARESAPVRRRGEDERVRAEHLAGLLGPGEAALAVLAQRGCGLGVQCDATLLVGLEVALGGTAARSPDRAAQPHRLPA